MAWALPLMMIGATAASMASQAAIAEAKRKQEAIKAKYSNLTGLTPSAVEDPNLVGTAAGGLASAVGQYQAGTNAAKAQADADLWKPIAEKYRTDLGLRLDKSIAANGGSPIAPISPTFKDSANAQIPGVGTWDEMQKQEQLKKLGILK